MFYRTQILVEKDVEKAVVGEKRVSTSLDQRARRSTNGFDARPTGSPPPPRIDEWLQQT